MALWSPLEVFYGGGGRVWRRMLFPSHTHFSAKTCGFSPVGRHVAKPAFWTPPKRVSFGTLHHILRYGVTLTGGVSYLFLWEGFTR